MGPACGLMLVSGQYWVRLMAMSWPLCAIASVLQKLPSSRVPAFATRMRLRMDSLIPSRFLSMRATVLPDSSSLVTMLMILGLWLIPKPYGTDGLNLRVVYRNNVLTCGYAFAVYGNQSLGLMPKNAKERGKTLTLRPSYRILIRYFFYSYALLQEL